MDGSPYVMPYGQPMPVPDYGATGGVLPMAYLPPGGPGQGPPMIPMSLPMTGYPPIMYSYPFAYSMPVPVAAPAPAPNNGPCRTLFIGNLAPAVTSELLNHIFSRYGTVTKIKHLNHKNYAFITFAEVSEAQAAKANAHGETIEGRQMRIGWGRDDSAGGPIQHNGGGHSPNPHHSDQSHLPPQLQYMYPVFPPQQQQPRPPKVDRSGTTTTLFIGNLATSVADDLLQSVFSPYGVISKVKISPDRRYGFVTFSTREEAVAAKDALNEFNLGGRPIRIGWGNDAMFGTEEELALKSEIGWYNDVLVLDIEQFLNMDELTFGRYLKSSLKRWRKDKRRGVWLKARINDSADPIKEGVFHTNSRGARLHFQRLHKPRDHVVDMVAYDPEQIAYRANPLRVGGFVVNHKNEILVVKEKYGPVTHIWKLPGGAVDPSEYIPEAVMREVKEETGIETEFVSILSVRQAHGQRLGKSDMYFTCLLKPVTSEITPQDEEIADAKWMPLSEFLNLDYYKSGVYGKILSVGVDAAKRKYSGFISEELPLVFSRGSNRLYYAKL